MALSHKDWDLPNSRIWLAEMDIDRGLDFLFLKWKTELQNKMGLFHLTMFISVRDKKVMRKKKK